MKKKDVFMGMAVAVIALVMVFGFGQPAQAAPKTIKVSGVISVTGPMAGQGEILQEIPTSC